MRFQQIFRITAEGGALLVDGIPLTILAEALEVFGGSPGPGLVGLPDGEEIYRQFGITGAPIYPRRRSMPLLTTCRIGAVGLHL